MLFIAHQFRLVSKSGQLFIHASFLGSEFAERKLTGHMNKCKQNKQRVHCAANAWNFLYHLNWHNGDICVYLCVCYAG